MMKRPSVVIMTERESLRALFRKAAGTSISALGFAADRSDLRILLGRGDVKAVMAEHTGPGSLAVDNLLWVQKHRPWIQLVLMAKQDPEEIPQAKAIQRVGTVVALPTSVSQARHLLKSHCLQDQQFEEATRCAAEELDYAPEKADQEIIRSMTELIDQLPALPLVVQRILNLLHREDTSPRQVAEVISLDPALAARVLRLVNSALFALAEPVTTVQHAVRLLGFGEIRNLTIGLKIMDAVSAEEGLLDRPRFWEHSLACGVCARLIALQTQHVDPDEAFLGGLLHDIGKLVLDGYFPDSWKEALERSRTEKRTPLELESEVVGLPHTSIGRMLAEHWKIPELHQLAIEHHHGAPQGVSMEEPERRFCGAIQVADSLVRWLDLGSSGPGVLAPVPKDLADLLGLDEETLSRVLRECVREVAEWKRTLGLHGSVPPADEQEQEAVGKDEFPLLWVVSPPPARAPTLASLLEARGHRVERSYWGEPVLEKAQQLNPGAVVLDFRWMKVNPEKIQRFLSALRSRTPSPILVVGSGGLQAEATEPVEGVQMLRGAPHLRSLENWLAGELDGL